MAYTLAEFKAEVAANGGYEALAVMTFNNGFQHIFKTGEVFDPAVQLDEATETIWFFARDVTKREYKVSRKLMYLEGMVFAINPAERDLLDFRTIRY